MMTENSDNEMGNAPSPATTPRRTLSDLVADSLRFWEPRRLIYNAVLLLVVVGHAASNWPQSKNILTYEMILWLFMLAVLANVFYCAAYPVDLFVQFAGLRDKSSKWRWAVFAIGTAFAAVIAHFISIPITSGD